MRISDWSSDVCSSDLGDGLETIWQPEPPTVRFGDIAVEVPPFAFLQATAAGQAALVKTVREAIGDASAIADLFAGVGTFALSVQAGRKVYAAEGARDAIAALTGAANRARTLVATEHRDLFRRPLVPAELDRFGAVILDRSEELCVGQEGVSTRHSRGSPLP